jgi:hypothetical protein
MDAIALPAIIETCTVHDSVASFLRVSTFHCSACTLLLLLYLYRLWQQLNATHLHIQTSLTVTESFGLRMSSLAVQPFSCSLSLIVRFCLSVDCIWYSAGWSI